MNIKEKSIRNVKINLKKIRLYNDISLTNFKSTYISKEQPHTTTLTSTNNNLNNNNNNKSTCIQTESWQLKTIPLSSTTIKTEDDIIFKKPLPVTKKIFKPSKPLKIQKVISLGTHPYSFKRKETIRETEIEAVEKINKTPTDGFELLKSLDDKPTSVTEKKTNSELIAPNDNTDMDDLSKISKLLTDKINSLTCETVEMTDSKETSDFQFNNELLKEQQLFKEETEIVLQNNLVFCNNECEAKQGAFFEEVQEKEGKLITNSEKSNKKLMHEIDHLKTSPKDHTSKKEDEANSNLNGNCPIAKDHTSKKEDEANSNLNGNCPIVKETFILSKLSDMEGISSDLNDERETISNPNEFINGVLSGNERTNKLITKEIEYNSLANKCQVEINNASINTKHGGISELTDSTECNSEGNITEDTLTSTLEKESETDLKCTEITQNSAKLVANFSAEFLAGLPNEPSPSQNDISETECDAKGDIDFEFDNNCSTPTMCRIDLDVMSENTSDVPATMPLTTLAMDECEADKLLEDFNNKSEDIVGSALKKKPPISEVAISSTINKSFTVSISSNDVLPNNENKINKELSVVDIMKENLKRLRDKDAVDDIENSVSKSTKKANMTSNAGLPEQTQSSEILQELKNVISSISVINSEVIQAKDIDIDCVQNKESTNPNKKATIELIEFSKPYKNKKTNFLNHEETKESACEKKLKKQNKEPKSFERTQSPPKENSEDTAKSQSGIEENEENSCTKLERSTKDEITPQEMETSINENQHMTVELGNWKQELQDETKTNDSEPGGGVSAIFSFPKIPIISISIHTTPNNKTYFKISNRENDNETKESGKTKKNKSQPDKEGQANDEERSATSSSLEANEIKRKEKLIQHPPKRYEEEEEEEVERDEEDEEEEEEVEVEVEEKKEEDESDNFDTEKFSHDSNSACSLPLKKRPTQAEPNGDTEDSESIVSCSYEQSQEIAAEVVIENTCKDKTLIDDTSLALEQGVKQNEDEAEEEILSDTAQENSHMDGSFNLLNDFDDNKPSNSSACFKKVSEPSTTFKRRVHIPIRSMGQTPIQIVAPQLKDNSPSPSHDHRTTDAQVCSSTRMAAQGIQPLPESYPATPMLSVANVEKLMDFNRFIEDLLASPDVVTIIDNANACGYYAEGQAYELERIAILEHYNIANAKGNTSITKPLYWKKSAGDTISIFNDNDNEWISLPPSTAKQLQKLSFVLSILQQQYKVNDVRQRINIALTFLIRNTSKYKSNSSSGLIQQHMSLYSRNNSDLNSSNHNVSQPLPSTSYFRIATNNEALNTNFSMNPNSESVQDCHSTNYSNNQQQPEIEPIANNNNQNWNNIITVKSTEQTNSVNSPQRLSSSNLEYEQQQQQTSTQDKRNSSLDELNNDQLYINPPCATSPQNEVIVNTNGVELHEIPQDQQNIFISITDEAGSANGNAESPLHKYNTRQQQQNFRMLGDGEMASSSASLVQQSCAKRPCLGNSGASLIPNHFIRNTIIPNFGNQAINLQNPYRMQQQHQMTSQNLNGASSSNFPQRNVSPQNSSINIYNNNRHSSSLTQQQQQSQQCMSTIITSSFDSPANSQITQTKSNESNYKDILQPYITYLIKDHEKTSKHLLQVFEEVSNSNRPNGPVNNNLNQQTLSQNHQQFNSFLPPLIRNPQQNHMPGLHQMPGSSGSVLPLLVRNPHQNILHGRDSGALQVVQSFIEQSQSSFDAVEQQRILTDPQQQQKQTASSLPGFAKEYANFVGSRDELMQKQKLPNFDIERQQEQQKQQAFNEQFLQQQQETQQLNSIKRKCQERNDKLAEDLKRKIVEFSLIKHNVQVKLLQKQQDQQQQVEKNQIEKSTVTTKRRGRPRKINKLPLYNNTSSPNCNKTCHISSLYSKDKGQNKCTTRQARRKQTGNDLPTATTTIDHAYFRQRSAAREAIKRINATVNSSFQ